MRLVFAKLILDFFSSRYFPEHSENTNDYKSKNEKFLNNKKIIDAAAANSSDTTAAENLEQLKKDIPDIETYLNETQTELATLM